MTSYLTVNEIEELAESLVRKFYGRRQKIPQAVDIDGFITKFLKLPIEYHSFAEADSGKIGFISDGVMPLWIYRNGAKPILFPRGTIVLEKALLHPCEENRRRFTLAHEASHYLLDRAITVASFHREYDNERTYSTQDLRELFSFRENQMDRMAAAVLMPKFMVRNILDKFTSDKPVSVYGDNLLSVEDKLLVQKMANAMGVSYTAFFIRLKQLGLYKSRSVDEFITQEMRLGNEAMPW